MLMHMRETSLSIQPTPRERHEPALELLFSALPPDERVAQMAMTLGALRSGKLTSETLLEAVRGEEVVGAIWTCDLGGHASLVWPPQLAAGEDELAATRLLEAAQSQMRTRGVQLATAFLADHDSPDAQKLLRFGFRRAAEISYLASERSRFPAHPPAPHLEFEPFRDSQQPRLAALVERTYEQTLDCPALNGARNIDDVLEGYRQTGVYAPRRWLFVRQDNIDVGCLLLADHPQHDQWELVYMGVAPEYRGQGIGLDVTRHAQWLTNCAARARLVLAVDAANLPAAQGYIAAGFRQWDRRIVLIKRLA